MRIVYTCNENVDRFWCTSWLFFKIHDSFFLKKFFVPKYWQVLQDECYYANIIFLDILGDTFIALGRAVYYKSVFNVREIMSNLHFNCWYRRCYLHVFTLFCNYVTLVTFYQGISKHHLSTLRQFEFSHHFWFFFFSFLTFFSPNYYYILKIKMDRF